MQVAINKSTTYEIIFNHNPKVKASSCTVLLNGKIIGSALVGETKKCFSRDCGRKRALAQAMIRVPVGDRYKIWESYRADMTPTPRWPQQKLTKELATSLKLREEARIKKNEAFIKEREARRKRRLSLQASAPVKRLVHTSTLAASSKEASSK